METFHGEGTHSRSSQGSHTAGTVVSVISGLIASVLALHIVFVIFEANQGNQFALFIHDTAQSLSLGMGPLFTPGNAKTGVLLNYGLAAVLYLGAGHLLSRLFRRH